MHVKWHVKYAVLFFAIFVLITEFMEQSIRLKTDELKPSLIEGLKKYFLAINAKEITISFSTPKKDTLRHETQEETNARIERAIKEVEIGNSISFTGEEFKQLSKALLRIR